MAYDEGLATRVRELVADEPGLVETRIFGGLAMLLGGNLACGVHGEELIVHTDPTQADAQLDETGAHAFDITGRPMKGWLLVAPEGCADDSDLARWVSRGLTYARALPPK